ncbi:hypothetical protein [Micromonospora cremea]|nr:hypothetical protein [Micromonospora cremea]
MIRRSGLDEALTGGLLPTGPGPQGKQTFDQWRASPAAQNTTGRTR